MDSVSTSDNAVLKPSIISGVKTFVPLENNPETLQHLSALFGLQNVSFHDIFSLTDLSINAAIPRPVHALIFLCPTRVWSPFHPENPNNEIRSQGPNATVSPLSHTDGAVTWFPQTIGHACGTMSLIHAVAHISSSTFQSHVPDSSLLGRLLANAPDMTPQDRATMLYDSQELEDAHMIAAVRGDSRPPAPEEENTLHFISYVRGRDDCLWELEGMREGVINLGKMASDEDVYNNKMLQLGPLRYIEHGRKVGEDSFSCVAMCLEHEA